MIYQVCHPGCAVAAIMERLAKVEDTGVWLKELRRLSFILALEVEAEAQGLPWDQSEDRYWGRCRVAGGEE